MPTPSLRPFWGWPHGEKTLLDRALPDLRVHSIPTGSHGSGWDLARYLYRGAAAINRSKVDECIALCRLGPMRIERLELLEAIHAVVEGTPGAPQTRETLVKSLPTFIKWVDQQHSNLTLATAKALYLAFADHLRQRVAAKTLGQVASCAPNGSRKPRSGCVRATITPIGPA